MPKMSEEDRKNAATINQKHKELYKNTEKYLADRHAAGQAHNPNWRSPKEHELSYWEKK